MAALVLAAVASSGCLRGNDQTPPPGGDTSHGVLTGAVLDDAGLPVPGAHIRALLHNVSATSEADGLYRIEQVTAGPVRLIASAEGHASQTRDVAVVAGAVNVVNFELRTFRVDPPYNRTLKFDGVLACNLSQAGGCGSATGTTDNNTFPFQAERGLEGVVVEINWTPTAGGTGERLRAELRAANETACGLPFDAGEGPSPLRLEPSEGFYVNGGRHCLVVGAPSDVVVVSQEFDAWVTLFYFEAPPAGFTANG